MNYIIIGDTDGLIAFINPTDANNEQASAILSFLEEHHATLYFPATTIAEAITTLIRKDASPSLAQQIIEHCRTGSIQVVSVDEAVIATAISLFNIHGSKQNTFFDAIVAAMAIILNADGIFSFDKWYKKQGFMLTSELVR